MIENESLDHLLAGVTVQEPHAWHGLQVFPLPGPTRTTAAGKKTGT